MEDPFIHPSSPTMRYSNGGWLLRRRGQQVGIVVDMSNGTPLPDELLVAVFTRFSDMADVVRCAASCRRWSRVVAREAAVLARALPPQLTRGPRALLGLFHQEDAGVAAPRKRRRSSSVAGGQPCFVATAEAARLLGFQSSNNISMSDGGDHGALLAYSRPVASRNGHLVVELRRERHADGVHLCVFNPMTGDVALLPPLSGKDKPGHYACALLTGDDLHHQAPRPTTAGFFFRVLIVYNRRSFTALRAYTSGATQWSSEAARSQGPKIDSGRLRRLSQGVVFHGVAYWPLRLSALAVRLDGPEPREVYMPPAGIMADWSQHGHVLGVTTDVKQQQLCFIEPGFFVDGDLLNAGLPFRSIVLHTSVLHRTVVGDDDGGSGHAAGEWERQDGRRIKLPQKMKVGAWDAIKLRCFCEKSGVLLFTLGEDSSCPGAYALNVTTKEIEKLADGTCCDSWRNVVGYEMDAAAYIASLIPCHS
ncbi:hypothetical protein ACP70R_045400 [Stipagrostis hirtigluma subsp. patula]